jgi:predicted DNA-binding protein (MmcQ/YjbR family)
MPEIIPAPYLAKHQWVTVKNSKALPKKELLRLITEAQQIVYSGLPKKIRQTIPF